MSNATIQALLIEDNPGDARLLRQMFAEAQGARFEVAYAMRMSQALESLAQRPFDVILTDLNLPDSAGAHTYQTLLAHAPHTPLVVLTGQDDDTLATQAVQAGAQDYLVKGLVDGQVLARSLRYAIERHRTAEVIRKLNETLSRQNTYLTTLHEVALDLLNRHDVDDLLQQIVMRAAALVGAAYGYLYLAEGEELVIRAVNAEAFASQVGFHMPRHAGLAGRVWASGQPMVIEDYRVWDERHSALDALNLRAVLSVPIRSGEECVGVLGLAHQDANLGFDEHQLQIVQLFAELASLVLDNAQLYAAVRERESQQRAILNNIPDMAWLKDTVGRFIAVNEAYGRASGQAPLDVAGKTDAHVWPPALAERYQHDDQTVVQSGQRMQIEEPLITADGEHRVVETIRMPIYGADNQVVGTTGIARDITDRKRAERRLNAQYAITRILSEANGLADATPRIIRVIAEGLEWDTGELWMVDVALKRLELVELWHSPAIPSADFAAFTRHRTFTRGDGFSGRVWAHDGPLWMADVMNEPGFPPLLLAGRAGLHGAIGFPIQLANDTLGVMTFFSRAIRPPDDDLLKMFTAIGSQIGQFIERRRAEAALRESEAKLDYLLRRFVPSSVADQLIASKQGVRLGGERRTISVLFADIRGYTALTEALEPPALMDLLNKYFGVIGRVILKHGGTINQYAGDMIMASFNAPNAQPDHALRAVRAAVEAQAALNATRDSQRPEATPQFGMGVNTGPVVVGYLGFEDRFDYATLGETTNIAFRLSSMAEGGQILVGPETLEAVNEQVLARPLGPLKLKGRTEPFPVHLVEGWLAATRGAD